MSWTETKSREGFPHGGMPHDALLMKMEETDPSWVSTSNYGDYDEYVRSEIVDWTPDRPYLESDQTRRDPGLSRSMLNVRYNGTRGSNPELPRHPEMFIGFMGNDPRGVDNTPRMDQVRAQMAARVQSLTTSMGKNDDNHIAERPWSGQEISYAMKESHRRLKKNHMRIFSTSKEGKALSRNIATDPYAASDLRTAVSLVANEGIEPGEFAGGDDYQSKDKTSGGVRGIDGFKNADVAPWRNVVPDTNMGVQKYGMKSGAGRSRIGESMVGGGRLTSTQADQGWQRAYQSRSTNRQTLGASMALASKSRHHMKSGQHDTTAGRSYVANFTPGSGLKPATNPESLIRESIATTTVNNHLTNAVNMAKGLKEGTASDIRKLANEIIADGARAPEHSEAQVGRGVTQSANIEAASRLTEIPIIRSGAAEDLEVQSYRGMVPTKQEDRAAYGRLGYDKMTWSEHRETMPIGRSKKAGEWKSATTGQTNLGDHADKVFGMTTEVSNSSNVLSAKSLRANEDSVHLDDDFTEF